MGSIHAVLLAAGAGRRMGGDKLLMKIGGRTVFEIALANHLGSTLSGVCAVVPGWIDGFAEVVERNAGDRITFVTMSAPCEMSASIKAGWRRVVDTTDAGSVMISLADQPLIGSGTLNILIDACRSSAKPVCIPTHRGRRGHPVIIARRLDKDIMELTGDRGARVIIESRPELVLEVEIAGDEVLLDLDRIEDLEVVKARLTARG
jgi:molybdenum cofactor cytidylyltransferase